MSVQPIVAITISQSLLRVGTLVTPTQPIQNLVEYDWNRETLSEILTQIKETHQTQSVRIVLSEAFSYVLCLPNLTPHELERSAVEQQLQVLIPEILGRVVWDYKETGLHLNPKNLTSEAIQVIAVDRSFLDDLSTAVHASGITVTAMEPISISLARQTLALTEPHAILYVGQVPLRLIAYKGLVLSSQILGTQLLGNHLGELFKYTQTHFGLTPSKIVLAGDTSKISTDQLQTLPIATETQVLDPMVGMALKTDLSGKDEWVLNLSPLTKEITQTHMTELPASPSIEIPSEPIQTSTNTESPHQSSLDVLFHPDTQPTSTTSPDSSNLGKRALMLGVMVGTAALVVGGYWVWHWYQQRPMAQPTVTPTPAPTATPSSTPAPISKADLKIQVLNGSGVAGVAGTMQRFLEALGYDRIDTANADTYDYTETEIQVKAGQAKLLQQLSDELKEEYPLTNDPEILDDKSEFDIVIIVGDTR